jgi:hypothetical protein
VFGIVTVWCVTGFEMFLDTGKSEALCKRVGSNGVSAGSTGLMLNVLLTINGEMR